MLTRPKLLFSLRLVFVILVLALVSTIIVAVVSIAGGNKPAQTVLPATVEPTSTPTGTLAPLLMSPSLWLPQRQRRLTYPEQTVTPNPTATPLPTATPTPRPTATPKPTATPTPEPLVQYQGMQKVIAALTVYVETPTGSGSGFFFDRSAGKERGTPDYVILTNKHVVKEHTNVKVCWSLSQKCVSGKVSDRAENMDIALIEHTSFRSSMLNQKFRRIVSSKWEGWGGSWDRGDVVYASGYPGGNKAKSREEVSEPVVTEGIVARDGLARYKNGWGIEYGAEGKSGSSGGPLMNNAGYIIGVVSGGNTEAERLGVAVPMGFILRWLQTGEEPGSTPTPTSRPTPAPRPTATLMHFLGLQQDLPGLGRPATLSLLGNPDQALHFRLAQGHSEPGFHPVNVHTP